MCSLMIVCVFYPRFELLAALGDRRALLSEPAALAPEAGSVQVVGEVSAPAEAFGVVSGMRLGEAMSRCPALRLVPPDPEGVRSLWNEVLDRLEAIGAEVESDRAGAAYFDAGGLQRIHGGDLAGVLAAARCALGAGARFGAAPSRFSAHAAALKARPRRRGRASGGHSARPGGVSTPPGGVSPLLRGVSTPPGGISTPPGAVVVDGTAVRRFLAPLPVSLLRIRLELQALPEVLEQLGIRTLGELAALPSRAVAERFGHPGLLALDLAQGRDTPLDPRRPPEPVAERLELPEAASGQQLERALELLVARVLARRERRGRSLRAIAVSARFVAGGTWRTTVTLRRASADPARICLALAPKLAELPAPAESLTVEVEAFGPPAQDQGRLLDEAAAIRRTKLGEAVRQARQAAGAEAALRVLEVDPDSRIPERRAVLAPFPDASAP
jgi:nucleotidyltransferase/DNA polymerase involved in DNA repair